MVPRASLTAADWHRLNRLLEQALELDAGARAAWFEALAAEDRHLQPVLTDLLAQSETTDFAATNDPPTTVARLASAALAAMRSEQPGDRVGPWRLERLLAEGGMGSVWLAQRADGVMQRTAALKLPRAEWIDRGLAARIARERAILARLQHPHIGVLYDAGLGVDGRPFLALEYVEGESIDVYCKNRALDAIVRLFILVARAVAFAHSRLVIHRDLKPSNVLVTADGVPKLLDFGISKLLEGEAPTVEATALTRMAGRPLTLAYAAPEQILGLPVSVAADVYSLGVMLFELLAGARLYRAGNPRELEAEVLRGDLRRPSDVAPDQARAKGLRGDLDAIVLTALKREAGERYQSAAALADDLARFLAGEPVTAQPDSGAYRLRKFVARHRLPVAAGAASLIALGVGLGASLWQAGIARDQAARATALNTFLLSLIKQADPNATPQTKAADVAMLAAIEQRIDKEFRGSPEQALELRVTVGDAYFNRGEMAAAQRVFQRAATEAAPQLPADDLRLLMAGVRAADYHLVVSGAASADLDRIIPLLRRKGAAGADLLVDALLIRHELGLYYGVPEFTPPERRFDAVNEALLVATQHFGNGSRQHLKVTLPLASLVEIFGSLAEASRMLETALASARQRTDDVQSSPEYRDASSAYAERLCRSGRATEGMPMLRDSVAAVRSAHGETSVQLERVLLELAECANAVNDPAGRSLPAEVFKIAAARERPPSTNLLRRAQSALDWALGMRDYESAEQYYQSAVENSGAIAEPALRDRLMGGVVANRVCLLAFRGDADEAEKLALPLVAAFDDEYSRLKRLTPFQPLLRACLSFAQRQNQRYAEAVQSAQTLVERCRAMKFKNPQPCEARALVAQALAELDWGRSAEASATLEQRLKLPHDFGRDPNLSLAYGRALLASGRPREAIEPLREAHVGMLDLAPTSPYAAELAYWLGQAHLATGDAQQGRALVMQAKQTLATSRVKSHQRLAAVSS